MTNKGRVRAIKLFAIVLLLALAAAMASIGCGKNPRYCDEATECGDPTFVCDYAGVCPESEGLTNSCIPPSAICWDAAVPDAVDSADAAIDAGACGVPMLLGSLSIPGLVSGLDIVGNRAYVGAETGGLRIIDITQNQPVGLSWFDTLDGAIDIAINGTLAYAAVSNGGLQIIDISNELSPFHVGSFDSTYAQGVDFIGTTAYLADQNSIYTLNIANPAMPQMLDSVVTPGDATAVDVVGGYAYVADDQGGLRVIDISDPGAIAEVSFFDPGGACRDVHVVDGRAYVAAGANGLSIIDVSNPVSPDELGRLDTVGNANGVWVIGTRAYVADGDAGLRIIDVSNPASPFQVGEYPTSGTSARVTVVGNRAYVTDNVSSGGRFLHVIDVCPQ